MNLKIMAAAVAALVAAGAVAAAAPGASVPALSVGVGADVPPEPQAQTGELTRMRTGSQPPQLANSGRTEAADTRGAPPQVR